MTWKMILRGSCLMIATDNVSVAHYINQLGSTHTQSHLDLMFTFCSLIDNTFWKHKLATQGIYNILANTLSPRSVSLHEVAAAPRHFLDDIPALQPPKL